MGVILDERKIIKFKINGAPRNILNTFLGGKHPFSDVAKAVCTVMLINMFFVIQPK